MTQLVAADLDYTLIHLSYCHVHLGSGWVVYCGGEVGVVGWVSNGYGESMGCRDAAKGKNGYRFSGLGKDLG